MSKEQKKGEFWFCYPAYKTLWASKSKDEILQAKCYLKERKEFYARMCGLPGIIAFDL
jgi:hypothetical protein